MISVKADKIVEEANGGQPDRGMHKAEPLRLFEPSAIERVGVWQARLVVPSYFTLFAT